MMGISGLGHKFSAVLILPGYPRFPDSAGTLRHGNASAKANRKKWLSRKPLQRDVKAPKGRNIIAQGVALGYKYYALSGHVFVRLNGRGSMGGLFLAS
jgi:hypothetical protein